MSGMHLSKEFFELLKSIGESKSKQEEDRIIQREIATLKKKMETKVSKAAIGVGNPPQNQLNANKKKAKEFLVRLLYVGKKSCTYQLAQANATYHITHIIPLY
jgi:AP-4 complex subunit epsilon-1|eukprot:scaffold1552_cov241-Chaetoceros_neogracile.AAC.3